MTFWCWVTCWEESEIDIGGSCGYVGDWEGIVDWGDVT